MRSTTLLLTTLAAGLFMGCSRNIDVGDDTGNDDTGTDTEDSDDTDTGGDSDTDTGGDTDTGPASDVDCQATYTTPAPIGGTGDDFCVTDDSLGCGDVVYATTNGGSTHFVKADYQTWGCIGPGDADGEATYAGPERVYRLYLEGPVIATLRLESPCDSLGLRAIRTPTPCEDAQSAPNLWCDRDADIEDIQEFNISLPANYDYTYDVVVDTWGSPANFKLSVECE